MSINIEEGNILSLYSSNFINRISVDFLSFGISQRDICQNCDGKFIFYDRKALCVSDCPSETIKNQSKLACERCSALFNMRKSLFSDACEC